MKHSLLIIAVGIASFVIGWYTHSIKIDANSKEVKINQAVKEDTLENIIATNSYCNPISFKEHLQYTLHDTTKQRIVADTVIPNKETAVKVAESLLFQFMGKAK